MLNIFKVNLNKIDLPKTVYVYELLFKTTEEKKRFMAFKRLQNIFGFVDLKERKLYSYVEIKNENLPKDVEKLVELKLQRVIQFNELDEFKRDKILSTYVKNRVREDIKSVLRSSRKHVLGGNRKVGRWYLYLTIEKNRIELIKVVDKILIAFNVKLRILGNKNLWDWLERDRRKLERLCWSPENPKDIKIWFRYVPDIKNGDDKNYLLTNVIDKSEAEKSTFTFDELRDYPIKIRGLTQEELKKIAKFDDFDEGQPIIRGSPNMKLKDTYSFLPQYCIPAYSPVLASSDEIDRIERIKNAIRNNKSGIIYNIVKRLDYLEQTDNLVIVKELDKKSTGLKAKFIKVKLISEKLDKNIKIKSEVISEPYDKIVRDTSELFKWVGVLWNLEKGILKHSEVEIPIPDFVPECLKGISDLKFFILMEEGLDETERKVALKLFKLTRTACRVIQDVYKQIGIEVLPKFNFRYDEAFRFVNSDEGVDEVVKKVCETIKESLGFALIFGRTKEVSGDDEDEGYDYYVPLKAKLFNNDILSQNFIMKHYIDNGDVNENTIRFALSNVTYNIFGKLGIKFFVLEEKIPYDYVLGVDVGYGEAYTSRVAGCTTIHDSEGRLRNIIPISKENLPDKETARIKALLEYIKSKYKYYKIDFTNKNILILRDGKIQQEEIEQLKEFSKKNRCKITIVGIRKDTIYQIFRKNTGLYYVKIGNMYLAKAHEPKVGYPRPVKIVEKVVIDGDMASYEEITDNDILLILKLTFLNYSIIGKPSNLRIPAPIYYADKLTKALKRGWKLREEFLKDGLLYFL